MNAIGYAQRAGGNPAVDKVLSIAFYFSDTLGVFGGVPDENLTITDTTDNLFNEYNFAGAHAGRFVRAVFTGNGGNPGGSELRFYGVPEPTGSLLALAGVGAVMLRRRRA